MKIHKPKDVFKGILQEHYKLAMIYKDCIDNPKTEEHLAKFTGQYLTDQDTTNASEIKLRAIAQEFAILERDPKEYMKWFDYGKLYGAYLIKNKDEKSQDKIDLKDEIRQHLRGISQKPEHLTRDIYDLREAALNFGSHTFLKRQIHPKDIEDLNGMYNEVYDKISELSANPNLDEAIKQELERMLFDPENLKSALNLNRGIKQAIDQGKGNSIISEEIKYKNSDEILYRVFKNELEEKIAEYNSTIDEPRKMTEKFSIVAEPTSYEHKTEALQYTHKALNPDYTTNSEIYDEGDPLLANYDNRDQSFNEKNQAPPQQKIPDIKLDLIKDNQLTEANKALLGSREDANTGVWLKNLNDIGSLTIENDQTLPKIDALFKKSIASLSTEDRKKIAENIKNLKKLLSAQTWDKDVILQIALPNLENLKKLLASSQTKLETIEEVEED